MDRLLRQFSLLQPKFCFQHEFVFQVKEGILDRLPKPHGIGGTRLPLATSKAYTPAQLPGPALLMQVLIKGNKKICVKEPALYHSPSMQVAYFNKGSI